LARNPALNHYPDPLAKVTFHDDQLTFPECVNGCIYAVFMVDAVIQACKKPS